MNMAVAENLKETRKRRPPFTARAVLTMTGAGRYSDPGCTGLWLQITPAGHRSWLLRYMLDGRARAMGLGPLELVSLTEARDLARAARRLLLEGKDPIDERNTQRNAARLDVA